MAELHGVPWHEHDAALGAARQRVIEFRRVAKHARLHDPRREFALVEVESEIRTDPLTGDSARICHFVVPARQAPAVAALGEATRAQCPFCPERVTAITPRYPDDLLPGGRLRRGEALLFPNLFPYDDVSAIVVLGREHCVPMDGFDPGLVGDALLLARDFIRLAAPQVAGEAFGIVTWNYMPPAGASQIHPHLQVIVTDTPGNALRRELAAESAWLARHGLPYADALAAAEAGGERQVLAADGHAWRVPFCPVGMLGDAEARFEARATLAGCTDTELRGFAVSLSRLLAAYARLGHWSFNLTLFPDHEGECSGRHRLTARLLPRFWLHPALHNSDVAYLQLLLAERFAMVLPETHAAALREALAQ